MGREMGPIAKPEKIEFVDSLPKSLVGKVLKKELRERAARSE